PPQTKTAKSSQPPLDPETKLKFDMIHRVQELIRTKKFVVAIAVVEGLRERYPQAPEVVHWQAIAYYRMGSELLIQKKYREAEIYLRKTLETDPKNRELCFEAQHELERAQQGV
ncbi:MAG: J domain-containing protein, partial [Oscillatoriales cyanobacterium SM2_2_1]|nr:J domain-containing protein [Oscillatoriales cyanobacterium SM2_2_1]